MSKIKEGQGLEDIIFSLQEYSGSPSKWMDLGAGVVTLFWSISIHTDSLKSIDVCDLVPEALFVLKKFILSDEIPNS